jgi:hypothetical protein
MPTPTEIKHKNYTYCKKYDVHCECPGCDKMNPKCQSNCKECNGEAIYSESEPYSSYSSFCSFVCSRWRDEKGKLVKNLIS